MQNIGSHPIKTLSEGAGLNCFNCRKLKISGSQFIKLNSVKGGAIILEESENNKLESDRYGKYNISGSSFDSCQANAGGAIYMKNTQYVTIGKGSKFTSNLAKNTSDETLKKVRGTGGSIYYECNTDSFDCLFDISYTTFSANYAAIKGGAIHWDTVEPLFGGVTNNGNFSLLRMQNNRAGRYGDNISTFPHQIAIISETDYKSTVFSSTILKQQFRESGRLLQIQEDYNSTTSIVSNVTYNTSEQLSSQRSGGIIPKMYIALVDKYGQIVSSDDESNINVMIDAFAAEKGSSLNFPPFIEGTTQYQVQAGVVKVSEIGFTATPGYNYSLRFGSYAIDSNKVSASSSSIQNQTISNFSRLDQIFLPLQRNISELLNLTEQDLQVKVNISLRECEVGEQFQWNGKCNSCPTNTSFSLIKMDEPGECKACPSDRALCNGGKDIGPLPGYWRKSNKTSNFIGCLYRPACLGMIQPENNPKGSCAQGYYGILCTGCKSGYTRTREYQCSKCPPSWWIILRIFIILLCLLLLLILLLRAQSESLYLHVYLRLLFNHIQLILIISTFHFNWPDRLQDFFELSRPFSQPFSELLSLGCLFSQTSYGKADTVSQFYIQLVVLGILPIIFMAAAWAFWRIKLGKGEKLEYHESGGKTVQTEIQLRGEGEKSVKMERLKISDNVIQTFIILMFVSLPNIMQFMMYSFKCIDIDGELRLKADLEIKCWTTTHSIFAYLFALPSLLVWGLGFSISIFWALTKNRASIIKADNIHVKLSYGFLYDGYKSDFYFWELGILLRKLIIISICVFVTNYGALTQALIVLLILVLFLVLTSRKRPFINESLFDLEAISISTAMISVYCGLFYLSDTSTLGFSFADRVSDVTFDLGEGTKRFLFAAIIIVNCVFFFYWIWRVITEMEALRGYILRRYPKLYLAIFACGDQDQAYIDKQKQRVIEDNEGNKEEFMRMLRTMKQMYNRGDLLLNEAVMKRLRLYMNPEKVLQIAGVVDVHDTDLTKKIQAQLLNQYDIQVKNGGIAGGTHTHHIDLLHDDMRRQHIIGSLLAQNEEKVGPADATNSLLLNEAGVTREDYGRYLQVLSAMKENMKNENKGGNTNDESNMSHLHDLLEGDIDGISDPSYVMNPSLLGPIPNEYQRNKEFGDTNYSQQRQMLGQDKNRQTFISFKNEETPGGGGPNLLKDDSKSLRIQKDLDSQSISGLKQPGQPQTMQNGLLAEKSFVHKPNASESGLKKSGPKLLINKNDPVGMKRNNLGLDDEIIIQHENESRNIQQLLEQAKLSVGFPNNYNSSLFEEDEEVQQQTNNLDRKRKKKNFLNLLD